MPKRLARCLRFSSSESSAEVDSVVVGGVVLGTGEAESFVEGNFGESTVGVVVVVV